MEFFEIVFLIIFGCFVFTLASVLWYFCRCVKRVEDDIEHV